MDKLLNDINIEIENAKPQDRYKIYTQNIEKLKLQKQLIEDYKANADNYNKIDQKTFEKYSKYLASVKNKDLSLEEIIICAQKSNDCIYYVNNHIINID